MRWYLNPFKLRDAARDACRITSAGGPRALRLTGIERPQGWLLPASRVGLEVIARDGAKASFAPEFPVPLPLAYGYRLARVLGLPVIGELDPEDIEITLGRGRRETPYSASS